MLTVSAVFLVGLLGSAHCVGMCGGFVALLGMGDGPPVWLRQTAYFAGKTATYTLFGALAGLAGALIADVLGAFSGVLAIGLGALMVTIGVGLCGVAWQNARVPGARIAARFGAAIGTLTRSGSLPSLAVLGALNGLLPCGLVYGMLGVASATGSAATGAATMAVFGLATVPALAFTGWLGGRFQPRRRLRMQQLAGVLVIAMGLLTVARGAHALAPGTHSHSAPASHLICSPIP